MSDGAVDRGSLRLGSRVLAWGTRTFVMGVLNVTPDSFSGDGVARDADALRARIDTLLDAAPDVIDVGGESTRPGAAEVPVREEIGRITPALEALRERAPDMPLSIDTRKAAVAHAALDLGAVMVNDVTGGRHDPEILEVTAAAGAAFVVTHNRRGQVRRSEIGPHLESVAYDDLVRDVRQDGQRLLDRAQRAGIPRDRLLFDPGFGFGKSPEQNLDLLREMGAVAVAGDSPSGGRVAQVVRWVRAWAARRPAAGGARWLPPSLRWPTAPIWCGSTTCGLPSGLWPWPTRFIARARMPGAFRWTAGEVTLDSRFRGNDGTAIAGFRSLGRVARVPRRSYPRQSLRARVMQGAAPMS